VNKLVELQIKKIEADAKKERDARKVLPCPSCHATCVTRMSKEFICGQCGNQWGMVYTEKVKSRAVWLMDQENK
jgi:ribosomal protein L37AE/L43A